MLFSLYDDLSCFYLTSFTYLPRNQFLLNSTHLYTLHNVLLLTCSISYLLFLLWIYGTLNNITITINIIQYTCSVNSTDDSQRRPTTDRLVLTGKMRESVHGRAVRSPRSGCKVTSTSRDQFSRYSLWLDTLPTVLV